MAAAGLGVIGGLALAGKLRRLSSPIVFSNNYFWVACLFFFFPPRARGMYIDKNVCLLQGRGVGTTNCADRRSWFVQNPSVLEYQLSNEPSPTIRDKDPCAEPQNQHSIPALEKGNMGLQILLASCSVCVPARLFDATSSLAPHTSTRPFILDLNFGKLIP